MAAGIWCQLAAFCLGQGVIIPAVEFILGAGPEESYPVFHQGLEDRHERRREIDCGRFPHLGLQADAVDLALIHIDHVGAQTPHFAGHKPRVDHYQRDGGIYTALLPNAPEGFLFAFCEGLALGLVEGGQSYQVRQGVIHPALCPGDIIQVGQQDLHVTGRVVCPGLFRDERLQLGHGQRVHRPGV